MKKSVAIIGGGPSALLLAAFLDESKFEVTIYERNKTVGRKFLVAGKGGFNLTHSEEMPSFVKRYTSADFLDKALHEFNNLHLREWLKSIGIETFVGTSKRVFPVEGIKPVEVLNRILDYLSQKKVVLKTEKLWNGWNENGSLLFNYDEIHDADFTVFALGGASWKVTGSDGAWSTHFEKLGVKVLPFQASNCAFKVDWMDEFLQKNEGQPLKNIAVDCENKSQKGEAMVTKFGIEGNAIYALSPQIQNQLKQDGFAKIYLDFKPVWTEETIFQKLRNSKVKNVSDKLKKTLKLSKVQIDLLKAYLSKETYTDPCKLASKIKSFSIRLVGDAPMDEAISTTGGIPISSLNAQFELKQKPSTFCIGEMVDWNAPTGGYLLQGCFSMGVHVARHLNGIVK